MFSECNAVNESDGNSTESFDVSIYRQFGATYHEKYGVIFPRKGGARYIKVSPGSMSVWDSTKRYDFEPIRIRNRVYYKLSVLDKFRME